tara:strand:+ start:90 stop:617 length:528 start_codon:yes stop_codon:yes gene_type:complete
MNQEDDIKLYPDFLLEEHLKIFNAVCTNCSDSQGTKYLWDSSDKIPFQGFIHKAFPIRRDSNLGIILIANFAVQKIVSLQNFETASLRRAFINVFPRGLEGGWHTDNDKKDTYSLIINTSNSDGGTDIGEKFYKNNFNEAILFNSNLNHRGIGPTNSLYRRSLALIIKPLEGNSL